MIRKIINIDEEKCNGCGLCVTACHEGAIEMIDGKAKLVRENYCDGLGDCLPTCPTGAIAFVEREAPEYDEAAVKKAQEERREEDRSRHGHHGMHEHRGGGCPGSRAMQFGQTPADETGSTENQTANDSVRAVNRLAQWPCQIKLVPIEAPFFDNAKLLIAADCTAYAYANMHEDFMKGKTTIVGCPKLDDIDYSEKLTEIIRNNDIREVTVVRMEVPCCGGLEMAAKKALQESGKFIPWHVVTISLDGRILD